jgi:hypothetical protein
MRRRCIALGVLVGAALVVTACEHPIGVVTAHIEASDLLVRDTAGQLLVRTLDNQRWSGAGLTVRAGDSVPLVIRLVDFQGREFGLDARGDDYSVRMDVEQTASAVWEPLRRIGWLRAFVPATTRMRVQIWHTDHADFVTPWLPLTVHDR